MKIATVDLDGEVPTHILITKGWGFIVARTDGHIVVLTVNGLLVQKIKIPGGFSRWFTFRFPPGFDYIGLYMDNGSLHYFEAAQPTNQPTVM
jgi:hypothetical protein